VFFLRLFLGECSVLRIKYLPCFGCIHLAFVAHSNILDEASSALDALTEKDFLERLRILLDSKDNNISAILFITHKSSVIRACDRVAVLSHGRIVE